MELTFPICGPFLYFWLPQRCPCGKYGVPLSFATYQEKIKLLR